MTNREAYKGFLSIAEDSLNKIDKMKGFVKNDSQLYKKEHNIAADAMQEALMISAKCHMLKEDFFNDPTIKKIIDSHLEQAEHWNNLKLLSMGFKSTMLFDVLGNILTTKSIDYYNKHIIAEDFAAASKFMILKYLSMSQNAQVRNIVIDNYITLERMPTYILYKWLMFNIPKQSNSFIRYIR